MTTSKATQVPVLLLIYNRPGPTQQTFDAIRKARPERLYVAADGPRYDRPGDQAACAQTRSIATAVDWPCEVFTLFRDQNLGLKLAVSTAIDWFFSRELQGIVLEDDCVASSDFFTFCETLLEYHADNRKVISITGGNYQQGQLRGPASYYYSRYNHCWGWASWRRSWELYERDIPFWPELRDSQRWVEMVPEKVERRYWTSIFERVYRGELNSWAYSWTASAWHHGGLTATPNKNLVVNVGFGRDATHTRSRPSKRIPREFHSLSEIQHPTEICPDIEADRFTFDSHYQGRNLRYPRKLILPLYRMIRKWSR